MEENSIDSIYENINTKHKYKIIINNLLKITKSEHCCICYNVEIFSNNISRSRDSSNDDKIKYTSQYLTSSSNYCNYNGILNYLNIDLLSDVIFFNNVIDYKINTLFNNRLKNILVIPLSCENQGVVGHIFVCNSEHGYNNDLIENNEIKIISSICSLMIDNFTIHEKYRNINKTNEDSIINNMYVANVMHEIRNPLNSIIGSIDVLDNGGMNKNQLETLEIMQASSLTLLSLINNMLDISSIHAKKLKFYLLECNIKNIIESSYNITKQGKREEVSFNINYDKNMTFNIISDPQRLKQIIINLLSNAFKFTHTGSITIKVSKATSDDIIKYNLFDANFVCEKLNKTNTRRNINKPKQNKQSVCIYLKIEVIDTGIGIKEEDRAKIFKSFCQVDSSKTKQYDGTGLGLAICNGLCKNLNGIIDFKNNKVGCNFYFIIPVETQSIQKEEIEYSKLISKKILLIDNDVNNLINFQKVLDTYEITFQNCTTATHAMQSYICNIKYSFDFYIINVNVEDINFNTLISSIRENDKNCYIIAIMNKEDNKQLDTYYDYVIEYPYTEHKIINTIYDAILEHEKISKSSNSASDTEEHDVMKIDVKKINKNLYINNKITPNSERHNNLIFNNFNINIMIVEDDSRNQKVINMILNSLGYYNIIILNNGSNAIKYVKKNNKCKIKKSKTTGKFINHSYYDLIIMDIYMAGMNGYEASKEIGLLFSKRKYRPKIVALTASTNHEERNFYLSDRVIDNFITKPATRLVIGEVLKKIKETHTV